MLDTLNLLLTITLKGILILFCYKIITIYIAMEEKKRSIQGLVAGGNSKRFLGKEYTLEKIEKMKEEDIDKLYLQYEAIYGSLMTKDLKTVMIYSLTSALNCVLPLEKEKLDKSLMEDVLLDNWLSTTACNIYQSFGSVLVPITTALKVLNHTNIGHGGKSEIKTTYKRDERGCIEGEQWGDEEGEEPEESESRIEECGEEERETGENTSEL